jgi:hypothetical protein
VTVLKNAYSRSPGIALEVVTARPETAGQTSRVSLGGYGSEAVETVSDAGENYPSVTSRKTYQSTGYPQVIHMPYRSPSVRCSAKRTDGEPCGNRPARFSNVCRYHGANAPQVKSARLRREAEAEAAKAMAKYAPDRKPMDNPVEALLSLASEIDGWREHLAGRVTELEQADWRRDHRAGEQLHAIVSLYERSLDRSARVLEAINRIGLEAVRTRLMERDADMMYQATANTLRRLGLSDDQQREAVTIMVEELRAVEAGNAQAAPYGRQAPAARPRAR